MIIKKFNESSDKEITLTFKIKESLLDDIVWSINRKVNDPKFVEIMEDNNFKVEFLSSFILGLVVPSVNNINDERFHILLIKEHCQWIVDLAFEEYYKIHPERKEADKFNF